MEPSSDPNYVVSEIRSFCQRRDQVGSDAARGLAVSYAKFCEDANRRLRVCDELLHKGLRAEALQLAEQEPVLLERVAGLQFVELPIWEELAVLYSYTAPPRLLLQSAEALNRTYADHEPLKPLLKEHRRLALTRSSLRERLAVLRKLVQLDPSARTWQDDLGAYEEARQRELRAEIDSALQRHEDIKAHTLLRELMESPWRSPLPPEFLQGTLQQYQEVLARGLADCRSRSDAIRARDLLTEWSRVAAVAGPAPGTPLLRRVKQVERWVEQTERDNIRALQLGSALSDLHKGLNDGCSIERLQELYAGAAGFGLPLPEEVVEYYRARLQTLAKRRKSNEVLILFSTLIGGLVVLVILFAFLLHK